MKRISFLTLCLLATTSLYAAEAAKKADDGFRLLFDGKTLSGWRNPYDWGQAAVVDGEIHLTTVKRKFFLVTDKQYGDFIFEAEVKLPEKGKSNSGFMFRCHVAKNKVFGYQAEVDPTSRKWSGGLYDEGRRRWLWPDKKKAETIEAFRKQAGESFKPKQWNKYRIECRGENLKIFVNGLKTTDYNDKLDAKGYLAIQHHGEKGQTYRFRHLRIRELPEAPKCTLGAPCPKGGKVLLGKGGDLSAWTQQRGGEAKWSYDKKTGTMTIKPKTGNLMTKESFGDFRLHVEFKLLPGGKGQGMSNSGVYLQNRYEVQILNSHGKAKLASNECGGLYKIKAPSVNACKAPGQWQSYDIDFTAARYDAKGKKIANAQTSVTQNGLRIHENVELPAPTGGGQKEVNTPGPLMLQDHGHAIEFRNIWIVPQAPAKP